MSSEFISTPRDNGRTEATPAHNGDRVDLHAGNDSLLDLDAARALVRAREVAQTRERENRPHAPHEIIGIVALNTSRMQIAEVSGDMAPVVPIPVRRHSDISDQAPSRAA